MLAHLPRGVDRLSQKSNGPTADTLALVAAKIHTISSLATNSEYAVKSRQTGCLA